jgi:hypothetical protein
MEFFLKHHNRTLLAEIYRKVHRYIVQACRDIEEYFIKKKKQRDDFNFMQHLILLNKI